MWIQTMDPADQLNYALDPLDPTKTGSTSLVPYKLYHTTVTAWQLMQQLETGCTEFD